MGLWGFLVKKIIFFPKNPGNHETKDEFTMNLRGYPTISTNLYNPLFYLQ